MEKWRAPRPGQPRYLRSRDAHGHGHVTKAILGEKNTALQEMHMDTSQEPFF